MSTDWKVSLLDCTFRDGGYVNNWEFGFGSIQSVFSRLDAAGVEIIEMGFLDENHPYNKNRTIYPDSKSIEPIFQYLPKPKATIVAMIDYGTCSINKLDDSDKSHLDGIRIIFRKNLQDEALEFARQVKDKGYKVFVNAVSITSFTDDDIKILAEKENKLMPDAVTMVDTYGLLHAPQLLHYASMYDQYLDKKITLAYHAHNNFQMAYANSITMLNNTWNRNLVIDATLFGMGKNAGNTCTELLAMYMNEYCGKHYDLNQIQEAIDVDIQKEFAKHEWGYRPKLYMASLDKCTPKYINYYLEKKTLSVKSLNDLIETIPSGNRLFFEKSIAEEYYQAFIKGFCNDSVTLKDLEKALQNKEVLVLGPGKTLEKEGTQIDTYILEKKPVTISVGFIPYGVHVDYAFFSNPKRFSQFYNMIKQDAGETKIICTSNVVEAANEIQYVVDYASLLTENDDIIRDNPFIMSLHLLEKLGLHKIVAAGFDGFSGDEAKDYSETYVSFLYCKDQLLLRNDAIRKELDRMEQNFSVHFLTTSKYKKI